MIGGSERWASRPGRLGDKGVVWTAELRDPVADRPRRRLSKRTGGYALNVRAWLRSWSPSGCCTTVAAGRFAVPPGRLNNGARPKGEVGFSGPAGAAVCTSVGKPQDGGWLRGDLLRRLHLGGDLRADARDQRWLCALDRGRRHDPSRLNRGDRKRQGEALRPKHRRPERSGGLHRCPLHRDRWRQWSGGRRGRPSGSEHAADRSIAGRAPEQLESTCSRCLRPYPLRRGSSQGVCRAPLIVDVASLPEEACPAQHEDTRVPIRAGAAVPRRAMNFRSERELQDRRQRRHPIEGRCRGTSSSSPT